MHTENIVAIRYFMLIHLKCETLPNCGMASDENMVLKKNTPCAPSVTGIVLCSMDVKLKVGEYTFSVHVPRAFSFTLPVSSHAI